MQVARFGFIRFGDEGIDSAVPDGDGVDWDAGGVRQLAPVAWRTVVAPVPQTFCSRQQSVLLSAVLRWDGARARQQPVIPPNMPPVTCNVCPCT